MRVRVDVVQPHPGAVRLGQLAELLAQVEHARLHRPAVPEAGAVLDVDAVGAGVLADHQQLLDAGLEQRAAPRASTSPIGRDTRSPRIDGMMQKRAAVVAAFADLQVGVVPRRQLDAAAGAAPGRRTDRAAWARAACTASITSCVACGPVTASTLRVHLAHQVAAALARLGAEAAGDDDLAVLGQRLADGVEALLDRVVDEAAGVDDHQVGAGEGLARSRSPRRAAA